MIRGVDKEKVDKAYHKTWAYGQRLKFVRAMEVYKRMRQTFARMKNEIDK